ncbi:MAG: hypothetical protein IAG10_02725 [Planctomycetaceae bacterium]|nr:hypothetical protein [Planctomycetaceae bacterium]
MRLGWNYVKLTALVSVLGLSIWTIGCGESASPTKPIAPANSNGGEAGSTKGGGIDVPAAPEGDPGAAKPAEDKPADAGEKPETPKADAEKDAPKADEAKKEDAPAEKKDEKKE